MADVQCDRCGHGLPTGGVVLVGGQNAFSPESVLGRYGPACARRIKAVRAEAGLATRVDRTPR